MEKTICELVVELIRVRDHQAKITRLKKDLARWNDEANLLKKGLAKTENKVAMLRKSLTEAKRDSDIEGLARRG